MQQSTRLILNSLVTYSRMAVTVVLGLVVTRLVIGTLGQEDFGVFAVLGSGAALLMLVSESLTSSTQRHLGYALGRGDQPLLLAYLNTALLMYLVLAIVVGGIGVLMGPVLLHGLTIPAERLAAAAWVYYAMIAGLSLSVLVTPFAAVALSHQAMVQDAVMQLLASVVTLAAAVGMKLLPGDMLVTYAVLLLTGQSLAILVNVSICLWRFPESRPRLRFCRWSVVRELVGFAGWNFLGAAAWGLRAQGMALLLNVFFGPLLNASYGLTNTLAGYHGNFSGAVLRAARPAMFGLEGSGDRHRSKTLALAISKFTTLSVLLWVIPLVLEMPVVLSVWLRGVPPYAEIFGQLALIYLTIELLGSGHVAAVYALGNIGPYARLVAGVSLLPLPLAAAGFYFWDLNPTWMLVINLVVVIMAMGIRVWYPRHLIGISVGQWARGVFLPVLYTAVAGVAAGLPAQWLMAPGLGRLVVVSVCCTGTVSVVGWWVALTGGERAYFRGFVNQAATRLGYHKVLEPIGSTDVNI